LLSDHPHFKIPTTYELCNNNLICLAYLSAIHFTRHFSTSGNLSEHAVVFAMKCAFSGGHSDRQTWLFSFTSMYHSTDLLTARGVAHLVVHGTSGSISYETIPPVRLETSGGVRTYSRLLFQTGSKSVRKAAGDRKKHVLAAISGTHGKIFPKFFN